MAMTTRSFGCAFCRGSAKSVTPTVTLTATTDAIGRVIKIESSG